MTTLPSWKCGCCAMARRIGSDTRFRAHRWPMMGSHAIDESDVPSGRERGGRSCSALATRMEKSFACLLPAIDRRGRTTDGRQALGFPVSEVGQ